MNSSQVNDKPFGQFQSLATITLAGFTGLLISIPLIVSSSLAVAIATSLFFSAAGFRIGYRKRHNKIFFYITLVSVLVLASLITGKMIPRPY